MPNKPQKEKEKRVSWGGTRVKRYSVPEKEEESSTENTRQTFDLSELKIENKEYFWDEEAVPVDLKNKTEINFYEKFNKENKTKETNFTEIKENSIKEEETQNKATNAPLSMVSEESIFTTSVKKKINMFESKIKNEVPNESLRREDNESEAMDTQKFNDMFKVNKPIVQTEEAVDTQDTEAMNTFNIKKLLNRMPFNPYDELLKRGIRFYTKEKIQFKRISVYQSNQSPDPSLFFYHKFFTKPLLLHLNDFIKFLLNLHTEIKDNHLNYSNLIHEEIFNNEEINDLLRELKGLSSTIYKITWYNLRKEKEMIFNNKIKDNKLLIDEEYNKVLEKKKELIKRINEKNEKIKELNEKIEKIKNKKGNFNELCQKDDLLNEDINSYILLKKRIIQDNTAVNNSYKREIEEYTDNIMNNKLIYDKLNSDYHIINEEIKQLEYKIKNKSVGEKEYLEMRDKFRKVTSISGLQIIKALDNIFVMRIGEYLVEFIISSGNVILIEGWNILVINKEFSNLFFFFIRNINLKNDLLRNGISKVLEINDKVKSIIKEINNIKFNSIINFNEEENQFIIKIKKFNKKIEEKEIIIKIKEDFSKEVLINGIINEFSKYGFIKEAYERE